MKNLKGLKVSLDQMPVIPGRPDLNAEYILRSINRAVKNKIDILVLPELAVSGYLISDLFEDESFVREVDRCNDIIIKAVPENLIVIFGTLASSSHYKNEDGRMRKSNCAVVAGNGLAQYFITKTLQPNYSIFDDDRHFYGTRKLAESSGFDAADYLKPLRIKTRIGSFSIGVILCEDMWHENYPCNPTEILVDKGAELIFNLSASPWSWHKNRKRHQIVRALLKKSPVPFIYVNNTCMQNNGKNIIVFDGSSTVYDGYGQIMLAVPPYYEGAYDFTFAKPTSDLVLPSDLPLLSLAEQIRRDADELYVGWEYGVRQAFNLLPPSARKAVIGLSGGIDSAVDAVLMAQILGPENVYAINMPSQYNSETTKNLAKQLADNLGVHYEVRPITKIVGAICEATGTKVDSLSYENVQARARQEILAARCQDLGAVFICNSNKIEMAFGYGTLYGDIAGFIAPLGDLLKYEVYQMADYLNRVVYQREVIPQECFKLAPSAELKNKQKDPFHYGNLERRGYHDELVRAFIEFRLNPEWVLEKYLNQTLEQEFGLEPGTLKKLFKTATDFTADLELNYRRLMNSYFKRIQCPPINKLSRRSFGYDLRESLLSPFFTSRYLNLKK